MTAVITAIRRFNERYDYAGGFLLACLVFAVTLFRVPSVVEIQSEGVSDELQVMSIEQIAVPRRQTVKSVSTTEGDVNAEITTDRAQGTSLDENALDMAFYPSIVSPKPIGRFKNLYPAIARQYEVEAVAYASLLIDEQGKVVKVKIEGIRLTKELPEELKSQLVTAFAVDLRKILVGHQFTPAVFEGRRVPIWMDRQFTFRLTDAL